MVGQRYGMVTIRLSFTAKVKTTMQDIQGPFFELRHPPLDALCGHYDKPLPTLAELQEISEGYEYPFDRRDGPAARGPDGGPFLASMAIAIQHYLGLDPFGMEEIRITPKVPTYLSGENEFDFLLLRWKGMLSYFKSKAMDKIFEIKRQSMLSNIEQVRRAAKDIEVAFGYQLEQEQNPNSRHLQKAAASHLKKKGRSSYPLEGTTYDDLLVRWWCHNPCTVFRAYRSTTCVGAAVLLPIADQVFNKIKQGDMAIWEIEANHIRSKSTFFLVEAGTDSPLIGSAGQTTRTRCLAKTFLTQLAIGVPPGQEMNLHGLSFAASKTGEERLAETGYKRLTTRLRGTNFPLMEFGPNTDLQQRESMAQAIQYSRSANRDLFKEWLME